MSRKLATQAPTFYGGLAPQGVLGSDQFRGHQSTLSWDDGGAHDAMVAQIEEAVIRLREGLKAYGADQARDAVADYANSGFFDLAIIDGEVCVAFDFSNDQAAMRSYVRLADLIALSRKQAAEAGDPGLDQALARIGFGSTPVIRPSDVARPSGGRVSRGSPTPAALTGGQYPNIRR